MPFTEHASQAVIGWGTFLQIGTSAGAVLPPASDTFIDISELISLDPPDEQGDDVEVTHFASPARTKEYIRGLIDAGESTCGINYNPTIYANHALVKQLKASGDKRNIRMVLPGSIETIDFPGYVKGFKPSLSPGGALTAAVTLKVAGAVVSDI